MRHPASAHVFVADIEAPALSPEDAHHLRRVLRLRDGEEITVADGRGGWRRCAVRGDGLDPVAETEIVEPPPSLVTVAFALTKADRPELSIQKLTELGVDRIVPVAAARSIVQWDDVKAARNLERWRAIARAAAMQSRRARLPAVEPVTTLAEFAAREPGLALAHPGGESSFVDLTAVAVGPEGGWTDDEAALVGRHLDLGPTTLRAETAALAVGVLLTARRDGRIRAEGTF